MSVTKLAELAAQVSPNARAVTATATEGVLKRVVPSSSASDSSLSVSTKSAPLLRSRCGRFAGQWFDWTTGSAADRAQVGAVYAHVFKNDIGLIFDPNLDADFTDPLKYYSPSNRGAFFVVRDTEDSDRIVGTAALRHLVELGNQAEIKRMFFLPQCRGAGLGMATGKILVAKSAELGYEAVVLDTKRKLQAANTIYEKLGFTDCENYNGNPRADRFMRLRLAGSNPAHRANLSNAKL
jgi:GNAT superfamily N-acetyltransferase